MNYPVKCKLCQKDITVKVADDYPGKVEHLLAMATCNRCYDLREKRQTLEKSIGQLCLMLERNPKMEAKRRYELAESLVSLTKQYAQWMGEAYGMQGNLWDKCLVDAMVEKPGEWHRILVDYRHGFLETRA